jgi:NAD-dependent dihydropyrimidine dehydrogenase PreA subunit
MLRYLSNVATLMLFTPICNGCGMCIEVCPHGVFAIENRKAKIVDLDACMECGACAKNCPIGAIEVKSGTGCAAGIIAGAISGKGECDCGGGGCCG